MSELLQPNRPGRHHGPRTPDPEATRLKSLSERLAAMTDLDLYVFAEATVRRYLEWRSDDRAYDELLAVDAEWRRRGRGDDWRLRKQKLIEERRKQVLKDRDVSVFGKR